MLEIKSISWRNFLSYGDYQTTLDVSNLGQCLITGEVIEKDGITESLIRKSNGAGKSTIPNAIQWVLFGRTMHSRSPGDNVVNYFTGKNCYGQVVFKNGDSITRTRNTEGKNELIYVKDGDESTLTYDTLATAALQQQKLNKLFDLDWEVFCGSVFFNQYGKPWMEMADSTRKKAIERILHVDRLTYYANAAKGRCSDLDLTVKKLEVLKDSANSNIEQYKSEITRLQAMSSNFDNNKKLRIADAKRLITEEANKKNLIILPDIVKLKAKWDIISKVEARILDLRKELNAKNLEISKITGNIKSLQATVDVWKIKSGKMCASCEQPIESSHVSAKIDPILNELEANKSERETLTEATKAIEENIKKAETILREKRPDTTLESVEVLKRQIDAHTKQIARLNSDITRITNEDNPHEVSILQLRDKITKAEDDLKTVASEHKRMEALNHHYHYIYKSYNDRSKIKNFIFRDHVPFINSRLKYYLDIFELDIKIELTDSLGISSNMWGYEFESGGERKRTDVAFMLAMFDFHEQMYGRQCNVLVLDEVDGRMDDDGIDSLISIIKNDLAARVETVLIISHRNMMFDTFEREIKVTRKDRYSYLNLL